MWYFILAVLVIAATGYGVMSSVAREKQRLENTTRHRALKRKWDGLLDGSASEEGDSYQTYRERNRS